MLKRIIIAGLLITQPALAQQSYSFTDRVYVLARDQAELIKGLEQQLAQTRQEKADLQKKLDDTKCQP